MQYESSLVKRGPDNTVLLQTPRGWQALQSLLSRSAGVAILMLEDVEQIPQHSWQVGWGVIIFDVLLEFKCSKHEWCLQDFKHLLRELHSLPAVRLLVASRVVVDYEGGPSVRLSSLQLPAALELLAYTTKKDCAPWSTADAAAAEKVATALDCNALLVSIVGGFVSSGRFSVQVCPCTVSFACCIWL
jgi:hypothetical protein